MLQMQQSMQTLQQSGLVPPVPGFPPPGGLPGFGAMPRAPSTAGAEPTSCTIGGLDFSSLLSGAEPSAGRTAPTAAVTPTVRFTEQIRQLNGMGFTDEGANIRALTATNGNVNAAVDRLLSGL